MNDLEAFENELEQWLTGPSPETIADSFRLVPREVRATIPRRPADDDLEPIYYARLYAPWEGGTFGGVSWYIEYLQPENPDFAYCYATTPVGTDWGVMPLTSLAKIRGPAGIRLVLDPMYVPGTPPRDAMRPARSVSEEFAGRDFIENAGPADIERALKAGTPPDSLLRPALRYGKEKEVVASLLQAGADAESVDSNLRNLLHEVAYWGSEPSAVQLLVAHGARLEHKDLDGYTPLHLAALQGSCPTVVQALIDSGAEVESRTTELDPDAPVGACGETPLHIAVKRSSAVVVGMLLKAGADPKRRDDYGRTPIHGLGDRVGKIDEVLDLLLDHGADIRDRDHNGNRPSDHAFLAGREGAWNVLRTRMRQSGDAAGDDDAIPAVAREYFESLLRGGRGW